MKSPMLLPLYGESYGAPGWMIYFCPFFQDIKWKGGIRTMTGRAYLIEKMMDFVDLLLS